MCNKINNDHEYSGNAFRIGTEQHSAKNACLLLVIFVVVFITCRKNVQIYYGIGKLTVVFMTE